ncbi:MAG: hypothetical protein QXP53_00010 [Candidatus Pacearchaeota archaeon]
MTSGILLYEMRYKLFYIDCSIVLADDTFYERLIEYLKESKTNKILGGKNGILIRRIDEISENVKRSVQKLNEGRTVTETEIESALAL